MTTAALQARLIQAPVVSPWLRQAVRLLQLSTLDYVRALHESAESNPFLEVEDAPVEAVQSGTEAAPAAGDWSGRAAGSGTRLAQDVQSDMLQNIPQAESLHAHLHAQLGVQRLSEEERAWASAVVASLDDDGYLRTPLAELADALGWRADSSDNEDDEEGVPPVLRAALCRVQSLDPAGVGARNVQECLRLQLLARPAGEARALALRIVDRHLDLLATHNLPRLAVAAGKPVAEVRQAAESIRRLQARPGWTHGATLARYVVPDVVARKSGQVWTVRLNETAMPRVRLHGVYAGLYEQQREAGGRHAEMDGCLERARWTVQNLAQRRSTILAVTQAIVVRQRLFFDHGPMAMMPLGLREIADAVGVHASTVSRTVHGKYLATPFGVFELKFFFSRGLQRVGQGACAPSAMKALIRALVAGEIPGRPLSDAELARRLAEQGFRIARRTVTKYRQELKLASFERRVVA